MTKDNRAVLRTVHNLLVNAVGVARLPVERIDRPVDDDHVKILCHALQGVVDRAVGRTNDRAIVAGQPENLFPRGFDFRLHLLFPEPRQLAVVPAMYRKLVTLAGGTRHRVGQQVDSVPDDAERPPAAVFGKEVEQTRRVYARSVVEGQRNHRLFGVERGARVVLVAVRRRGGQRFAAADKRNRKRKCQRKAQGAPCKPNLFHFPSPAFALCFTVSLYAAHGGIYDAKTCKKGKSLSVAERQKLIEKTAFTRRCPT